MEPPPWNVFDTAYALIGAGLLLLIWAMTDVGVVLPLGAMTVVAYAAGRAAGAHR